ncbi:GNAT family N-acetyltransferase [Streptomyces sp. W16]|uniref:GNAT family N-acetyltransferase n=1 Tax=Streptomyces sp. W16 TaxID=3076631 RepID=UPI00295AC897|nr:GNAT family N-acetyltransferase [Streptomyces sp. W16]MDV9173877.1 GNAT family N-acetyltransferase [Streptomyces sp. W16]
MTTPSWHITADLDQFLGLAGDFLQSRPAPHTLQLTVTDALRRRGTHIYGDGDPQFGVLEHDGTVTATFFRTPPGRLMPTRLTPAEAEALAAQLVDRGIELPGIMAEQDTASTFAEAWRRRTGAVPEISVRQRLYRLAELTIPHPSPPGRPRVAVAKDREQLMRWHGEFVEAIGERGAMIGSAEWADARISYGGVTLWETSDGTPVSMAGVTAKVAGQIRVAPVYTPADLRGRGYAGAATAEVSRAAREAGAAEVLLFTDLANPTSNALYQRIGYRPVADFTAYDFGHDNGQR